MSTCHPSQSLDLFRLAVKFALLWNEYIRTALRPLLPLFPVRSIPVHFYSLVCL